ncbi:MAG: hypothetical protein ABW318_19170 [Vicinamibacterales bacterium]|jgi:hypothetical protein
MPKLLRFILAIVVGFVAGSAVNMGLIMLSGSVIPPPPGADVTTSEGLKASLHLFEPKHFAFPFLAHALGTFVGAFVATLLAPDRSTVPAYTVGTLFFLGGCAAVFMLPSPAWFNAVDLVLAYGPPTLAAYQLASRWQSRTHRAE